jgi:hypothetical protein
MTAIAAVAASHFIFMVELLLAPGPAITLKLREKVLFRLDDDQVDLTN